ncbi:MAG: hypothetical protein Q4G04_02585 [bacterium]|nr:hypothetical protein [bacterium]
MKKNNSVDDKINKLINYYKEKNLLIVGLNDSQGINTTSTFFKMGLLEYLALALTSDELMPVVINAFSLTMNKTEHIDYFLKNNLSLEEIKLSQIYSVVSALEKVMFDIKLPKAFGKIGNIYRLIYTPQNGDNQIRISTSLKNSTEPIMIYSSGVNNLMREVGANPFGIKKAYKRRDKSPNYYYTLEKTKDPKTLTKVINAIDRNFNTIFSINEDTDIYTLGAYIPKSLQNEEMNIFRDLIINYNDKLQDLCRIYGITFIDTANVGNIYNNSNTNFHISTAGHNALANYILGYIYQNKIKNKEDKNVNQSKDLDVITNKGALGVIALTSLDYKNSLEKANHLSGYEKQREMAIAQEHRRETEIFQKVLKKTK